MIIEDVKGIRFDQLTPCRICGGPVAGNTKYGKTIQLYRIAVESHYLDVGAVTQFAGLAQIMGGNEALANAITPQPIATMPVRINTVLVCQHCALDQLGILIEKARDPEEMADDDEDSRNG